MIQWDDFTKVEIKCGTIISAQAFPNAKKPAYQLTIDFGVHGIKKSSAQITTHYTIDQLIGMQIVAVVNFPPKQIANFMSECLVLGVYDENNQVVLLTPTKAVKNGQPIG